MYKATVKTSNSENANLNGFNVLKIKYSTIFGIITINYN